MRLHHLEVTAFGPFAGTETVDFDALGADGLFLLHGPTGAGKTTVLDAVAFALFGTLPGARRDPDGRRLLSDHAGPGATPRVVLELTVGGRRIRLERTPEHQRPKKRGAGTTRAQAGATLTWLTGPAAAPCTRIDEVAREVERLLGMSADQFFQVVLLPQGAFATFLRADTAERATLLEKLFDTRRFGDAEVWLGERRRASSAAVEVGTQQVRVAVARVATAAGTLAGAGLPEREAPDALLAWRDGLRAAAGAADTAATTVLEVARRRDALATSTLETARATATALLRREGAADRTAVLAVDAPGRAATAGELERARRAEVVAVAEREAAAARVRAGRAEHEVSTLAEQLAADPDGAAALARTGAGAEDVPGLFAVPGSGPGGAAPAARFALPDLTQECDAWRREVGRLAELVHLDQTARADTVRAGQLQQRADALGATLDGLLEQRRSLPLEREVADADVVAARRATDELPGLAAAAAHAQEVAEAAGAVPTAQRRAARARENHAGLVTAQQAARAHWLDLREQRLQGMAAELAGALADGAACTVCGAVEHPEPAQPSDRAVGQDQEDAAHTAEQVAAERVRTAGAEVATAESDLQVLRVRSAGTAPAGAAAVAEQARAAQARAVTVAATLEASRQRCAEVAGRGETLAQQELVLGQDRASATAQAAALGEAVAAVRVRLEAGRGADADVLARLQRLEALAGVAAKLVSAGAATTTERAAAREREQRALELAAEQGFETVAQALGAVLAEAEQARRARELELVARELDALAAVLAEPEVQRLDGVDAGTVRAALGAAEQERATAGDELGAAHAGAGSARRTHEQVRALGAELAAQLDRLGPALAEAERLAALADVVAGRGQNSRRISLHSYVLAARLEEVAVAASRRLRRMSGGRYEFVHTDAAGPRGTRGGLGLDVLDDHTGAQRSTKTLSGGESFMASLSLALGLADVVAEESGGVQLDTLFIDEGFGTLDAASLEEVMGVLDDLREGGRVVGLVSHVEELRQRIPSRLRVSTSRAGSHLAVGG